VVLWCPKEKSLPLTRPVANPGVAEAVDVVAAVAAAPQQQQQQEGEEEEERPESRVEGA